VNLQEASHILLEKYQGSFVNCVKACGRSAQHLLTQVVSDFSSYRDQAVLDSVTGTIYIMPFFCIILTSLYITYFLPSGLEKSFILSLYRNLFMYSQKNRLKLEKENYKILTNLTVYCRKKKLIVDR
jgi:hypothetical protein